MPNGHYSSNKHCQKKSHKKKTYRDKSNLAAGKVCFWCKTVAINQKLVIVVDFGVAVMVLTTIFARSNFGSTLFVVEKMVKKFH